MFAYFKNFTFVTL